MIDPAISGQFRHRIEERVRAWNVVVEHASETETSFIAFGRRGSRPVVLKVIRNEGDEWRAGEVLDAFEGKGVARVYDSVEGAVLLERITPGNSLVELTLNGRDEEATDILADVIHKMSPRRSVNACATVESSGEGFDRYVASGDERIPKNLLEEAREAYSELCVSQSHPRLLHGDLHHYNVLYDSGRGWLAIDPKGVVGELEYEVGAALRNPYERPDLLTDRSTIQRRLERFASRLNPDFGRALRWSFAQAVLSAIWSIEDGFAVDPENPGIALAIAIRAAFLTRF